MIDNWQCAGDATINEFFIRLTPDRQSKNGYCWSKKTFSSGEWVTTIKFRISGQVVILVTYYCREQAFLAMVSLFSSLRIVIIRVYVKHGLLIRRERCLEPVICSTVSLLYSQPSRTQKSTL